MLEQESLIVLVDLLRSDLGLLVVFFRTLIVQTDRGVELSDVELEDFIVVFGTDWRFGRIRCNVSLA